MPRNNKFNNIKCWLIQIKDTPKAFFSKMILLSFNFILPDNILNLMKFKLSLLLCWLGIHRYKIISSTFGFGPGGTVKRVQCKICGISNVRKG